MKPSHLIMGLVYHNIEIEIDDLRILRSTLAQRGCGSRELLKCERSLI